MKHRTIYPGRKTFSRYDDSHFIVYLDEEVIDEYIPEGAPDGFAPITGYAYTGDEPDGGTIIECAGGTRDELIDGIIRGVYSLSEENAIKTHQIIRLSEPGNDRAEEYATEWNTFNQFREHAIAEVDKFLAL